MTQIGEDDKVERDRRGALSAAARAGVDVLLDDRDERPGVKFKDADLIGFPVRIGVGAKSLANGQIEWSFRRDRAQATWRCG